MIGVPMPNPRDSMIDDLNRKLDQFFGAGGKAEPAPAFKAEQRPPRSDTIDPDTILKRRRPGSRRAGSPSPPRCHCLKSRPPGYSMPWVSGTSRGQHEANQQPGAPAPTTDMAGSTGLRN